MKKEKQAGILQREAGADKWHWETKGDAWSAVSSVKEKVGGLRLRVEHGFD